MATMSSDRFLVAFTSAGYAFRVRHAGTTLGAQRAAKRLLASKPTLVSVEVQEFDALSGVYCVTATAT